MSVMLTSSQNGDYLLVFKLGDELNDAAQLVIPTGVVRVESRQPGKPAVVRVVRQFGEIRLDQKSTRKIFQLFVTSGELVQVSAEFYFRADVIERLIARLRESAKASGDSTLDVAKFKELSGVSRKYAIPLLEYFDRRRVTQRIGDKRHVL